MTAECPNMNGTPTSNKEEKEEAIREITEALLKRRLESEVYDPVKCKHLSHEIAGELMRDLKQLQYYRYKIVAVVSLGSAGQKGTKFGSRCYWNENKDCFKCVKYSNDTLFAMAMIYILYVD
ncbi:unnamed protein product [Dimorphilus gyrociliatus]|uniref:Uncharacterized protein n=1 Tax=Dimorphilus gyrociliatus TaxID=2664684 RepID=A0A7I8W932_9ANNE|nr:unnamed protein product [Dimorphilus gyrociliatus]